MTRWLEKVAVAVNLKRVNRVLRWLLILMIVGWGIVILVADFRALPK